jgi:hypothetical protein
LSHPLRGKEGGGNLYISPQLSKESFGGSLGAWSLSPTAWEHRCLGPLPLLSGRFTVSFSRYRSADECVCLTTTEPSDHGLKCLRPGAKINLFSFDFLRYFVTAREN